MAKSHNLMTAIKEGKYTTVHNVKLHFQDMGSGEPVLLLHGWPTSSFLYRNIMPQIARNNRVIALDLPGFGLSEKNPRTTYSFRFYSKILSGFLEKLKIDSIGLAVHDLGGPVGLFWACCNPEKITKLAILNTLVYPEMSWAVKLFILMIKMPLFNSFLTSPSGLRIAMRFGIKDIKQHTREMFDGTTEPFKTADDRKALLKAGSDLQPKGFFLIAQRIKSFKIPVRIIYGEADKILPDIAQTVRRLQVDLPQAEVIPIPGCSHFLQEDRPELVSRLLADFFRGLKEK